MSRNVASRYSGSPNTLDTSSLSNNNIDSLLRSPVSTVGRQRTQTTVQQRDVTAFRDIQPSPQNTDTILRQPRYDNVATTTTTTSNNEYDDNNGSTGLVILSYLTLLTIIIAVIVVIYMDWRRNRREEQLIDSIKRRVDTIKPGDNKTATIGLFDGQTATGAATHDRPIWQMTRDTASQLITPDDHGELIMAYGDDYRKHGVSLIVFIYADWCGACKMHAPEYVKAAQKVARLGNFDHSRKVFLMILNEKEVPSAFAAVVKGYPTILTFDANSDSNLMRQLVRQPNKTFEGDVYSFCESAIKPPPAVEKALLEDMMNSNALAQLGELLKQ